MKKKRIEPIAKIRQPPPRPIADKYSFRWTDGNANPWKGRDCDDFTHDSLTWTILTDGNWWLAVWDEIVDEHGSETAGKFWKEFWTPQAIANREMTLRGTASYNWGGAMVAFNVARLEDHMESIIARTMEEHGYEEEPRYVKRMREDATSPETVAAHKRNLGEWLYRVIREGKTGHLEKLAALMRGNSPPVSEISNRECHRALSGFSEFVLQENKLPSIKELRDTSKSWNEFRKTRRRLGLSGLPRHVQRKK